MTQWQFGARTLIPVDFEEWFYTFDRNAFTQNRIGVGMEVVLQVVARLHWIRLDEKISDDWECHPVLGFQLQTSF